ncbi:hypothetical protein TRFO_03297 [Tritrichomonas foetus]|uniref:Uncharacterized protein n=1 Tax=Tritrichomonas foetus TaxID=1144522 RepID=A0A1J4KQI4_9EUKA|nr:hypothetical protein TRFO_03297 [Tritrichomonas foetus]|eukprot:OHT13551.1 hypothetical protein TRFO_03297 [Tritrichomonas foetus]
MHQKSMNSDFALIPNTKRSQKDVLAYITQYEYDSFQKWNLEMKVQSHNILFTPNPKLEEDMVKYDSLVELNSNNLSLYDEIETEIFASFINSQSFQISGKKIIFDISNHLIEHFRPIKSDNSVKSDFQYIDFPFHEIETTFSFKNYTKESYFPFPSKPIKIKGESNNSDFFASSEFRNIESFSSSNQSIILVDEPLNYINTLCSSSFLREEIGNHQNAFLSLKIPILKFECKPTMVFEPFTDEWLQELQIKKCDFENFTNLSKFELEVPKINKKLDFSSLKIDEEFSMMISKLPIKEDCFLNVFPKNFCFHYEYENEIPSKKIPTVVEINNEFFDENDIKQFSSLFGNLTIVGAKLRKPVLLTINRKLVNIIHISENSLFLSEFIANLCLLFDEVLITSTAQPCIFLGNQVKWRCITSVSQIGIVVIPFLLNVINLSK